MFESLCLCACVPVCLCLCVFACVSVPAYVDGCSDDEWETYWLEERVHPESTAEIAGAHAREYERMVSQSIKPSLKR